MAIDATAIARGVGVEAVYKDLRAGSILYLPQRIAVIAQGSTSATFSTTKFQATSASQVGATAGYGSPAHLIARQLFPQNGDGVGTIPVTFYLLDDHGSGVAAVGDITPSGTQTEAGTYYVLVNNIMSEAFTVAAGASVSARIAAAGAAIEAVLEMPVDVSYDYGTVTASALTGTGNGTLTALSAVGNALPGVWTLVVNTTVANGGVWTLTNPNGVVVSTNVTMTPGAGGATVITNPGSSGLEFTLTDGSTDFGLGASFTITVPATALNLTSKWKGASANGLRISVLGEELGTTWTMTQPTGGLTNPTIDAALAQIGNVWETMIINALDIADTTALNALQTFGEGRWGALVKKPLIAFTGNTATSVASATAISSTRRTDKVNAQIPSPGSDDLPFVVCARAVARIAKVANNNPPTDYGAQRLTGLTPGADGDQWTFAQRDQAIKLGSSTVEVVDGVVTIGDVVTFYRPTGEEPPAFRYVVDIVKLQQCIYNLDLEFSKAEWAGAPLIPDGQPTVNPNARTPEGAKAAACAILDSLGLNAIISDPETAKDNTTTGIDSINPKRLNLETTVQLSGNTLQKNVTLNFGFLFGQTTLAA
jgi:phage tail sheath gpL-like